MFGLVLSWTEIVDGTIDIMHYLSILLKDDLQSTCENGNLSQATVKYFGKEVGKGKVGPLQAKVLTIESFSPSTEKELMCFLELWLIC